MRRLAVLAFVLAAVPAVAQGPSAQGPALRDQSVAWRTYAATREARVRTFPCDDERRPLTVVIDDRAANGAPITDEAAFVAELVGRELGFDPTAATYVFRFTPAAFSSGAAERGKTLLLRATFSRLSSGNLGSPQWRVLTPDALDELTDRAFR